MSFEVTKCESRSCQFDDYQSVPHCIDDQVKYSENNNPLPVNLEEGQDGVSTPYAFATFFKSIADRLMGKKNKLKIGKKEFDVNVPRNAVHRIALTNNKFTEIKVYGSFRRLMQVLKNRFGAPTRLPDNDTYSCHGWERKNISVFRPLIPSSDSLVKVIMYPGSVEGDRYAVVYTFNNDGGLTEIDVSRLIKTTDGNTDIKSVAKVGFRSMAEAISSGPKKTPKKKIPSDYRGAKTKHVGAKIEHDSSKGTTTRHIGAIVEGFHLEGANYSGVEEDVLTDPPSRSGIKIPSADNQFEASGASQADIKLIGLRKGIRNVLQTTTSLSLTELVAKADELAKLWVERNGGKVGDGPTTEWIRAFMETFTLCQGLCEMLAFFLLTCTRHGTSLKITTCNNETLSHHKFNKIRTIFHQFHDFFGLFIFF